MLKKYPKWFWVALLGFLILLVFGTYFKVLRAEFVYDDFGFIVNNKDIQSFKPFSKFFLSPDIFTGSNYVAENAGGKNWRPVSSLAFAIEYRLFGPNPFGFHLISVLLHLINIVLVYFLISKIIGRKGITLAAVSLWALHPTLTEAVSWVTNQSSLIFLGFFLLTISAILGYLKDKNKKFLLWVSYLFFILSLLTKETALGGIFIIPFVFLLEYRGQEKINFRKILINSYPFVLIGLAYFYIHYRILGALGDHALRGSFLENLLLAPAVLYKYVSLAFYPVKLLLDYSNFPLPVSMSDPRVILGAVFFLAFAALIYFGFKKYWFYFILGAVWFLAFLLPVLQIIPFQDIIGERFLYAPILGFFLMLVVGFDTFFNYVNSKFNWNLYLAGKMIIVLALSSFFVLTFNRNNDWLNSENLWLSVFKVDDRNGRALQNLSAFYLERGEASKIIEFSERLIAVDPENRAGRLHLAVGKILNGQYEEAESELLDLIKKYPDFKEAKNNLSVLHKQLGRMDSAIQSIIVSPQTEGNVITSGIFGQIVFNGMPYEASLDVFSPQGSPVISIRSRSDGAFQIPLRPDSYVIKPNDPDGSRAPLRDQYTVVIGNNQWLRVRIEYK